MQYDLIIIGAGPAGLTAAVYAARYRLKIAVFGKEIGGQASHAYKIENYPGFKTISGLELIKKLKEQVKNLDVEIFEEEIIDIAKEKNHFVISTYNKKFNSKAIILALGTERKKLNLANEDRFGGKGISYCAICDAPLFKDKTVAVIGGSDAAAMSALLLAEYAKKTYVIYRGKQLRAEPIRVEQIKKNKKIEIIYDVNVKEIKGKNFVESLILDNEKELKVDGIFVEIGNVPPTYLIKKLEVKTDKEKYILTDKEMHTNIQGVFAAGDCCVKPLQQIVTAASDGAVAAFSAYSYLKSGGEKWD